MKKYGVCCTMTYNGYCEVEASSKEEAIEIAQSKLCNEYGDDFPTDGMFGIADFSFAEATADDAYEV